MCQSIQYILGILGGHTCYWYTFSGRIVATQVWKAKQTAIYIHHEDILIEILIITANNDNVVLSVEEHVLQIIFLNP